MREVHLDELEVAAFRIVEIQQVEDLLGVSSLLVPSEFTKKPLIWRLLRSSLYLFWSCSANFVKGSFCLIVKRVHCYIISAIFMLYPFLEAKYKFIADLGFFGISISLGKYLAFMQNIVDNWPLLGPER